GAISAPNSGDEASRRAAGYRMARVDSLMQLKLDDPNATPSSSAGGAGGAGASGSSTRSRATSRAAREVDADGNPLSGSIVGSLGAAGVSAILNATTVDAFEEVDDADGAAGEFAFNEDDE